MMSGIWLLATVVAAAADNVPSPVDNKNGLLWNIAGSIIAGIILLVLVYVSRRWILSQIRNRGGIYRVLCREKMRELRKAIRERRPPAVQALMVLTACETAIHLTSAQGEAIRLEEYGELLKHSLSEEVRKCRFIALTRPSDWYAEGEVGKQIQEYFKEQSDLMKPFKEQSDLMKLQERKSEKISMCRYLVLDKSAYDQCPKSKTKLIKAHADSDIDLFFCDTDKLDPNFVEQIHDMAIFEDANGWQWVVEGLDFSCKTISEHMSARIAPAVRARIEDRQDIIDNSYSTIVTRLSRIAKRET